MTNRPPEVPPSVIPQGPLRSGWTTGACATAAAKAAARLLFGQAPQETVQITLPKGQQPTFALAEQAQGPDWARAAVIKDAGDDPDVTHRALICATLRPLPAGSGIVFRAGTGVGTVTKPGLPLPPGEPAINPVPRQMMRQELHALALSLNQPADLEVEISIPNGEALAAQTWNPRLGILGGLSILGTTGIVVPYSCSAWIHSIQRGIDVARACGITHVAGCVGSTSERAVRAHHALPAEAIIDMGDFAGGLLKYLRAHPIPRLTIAGGFAKICKLADGHMDLHSSRSQVNTATLTHSLASLGAPPALLAQTQNANTALEILTLAQDYPLAPLIARQAHQAALKVLSPAPVRLDIVVVDRKGAVIGTFGGE
jgi:cobalt-precorrin-5B (C1)-methyltransferase